jgi:lipid A 3-O-deacylase
MRNWIVGALIAAAATATMATAAGASEIRLGVLAHDPLAGKEDGIDLNAEFFFNGWTGNEGEWQLRPSIGATVNLEGDTNQAHISLNYGGPISNSWFLEFSAGAAVHDGELETPDPHKKELGGRVLIRGAVSLGVMLSETVSLSIYADHLSNAGVEERNEGLETAGLRIGFKL